MQARIVETRSGALWLLDGWRLFRAAPPGWIALTFVYIVIMLLMSLIPVVGAAGFLVLYPALTVGLMSAARAASKTGAVEVGMLFDGFRGGWRVQIVLGAIYLACSIVVFAGVTLADQDQKLRALFAGGAQEVDAGDLIPPLAALAALYTPMMMMFWFAPLLAAWHGVGAAKSLFFSFVACVMNWRALLAYGLVSLAAIAVVATLLRFLSAFTAQIASREQAALPVFLVLAILLLPTLFASFYASYRDIFDESGSRDSV